MESAHTCGLPPDTVPSISLQPREVFLPMLIEWRERELLKGPMLVKAERGLKYQQFEPRHYYHALFWFGLVFGLVWWFGLFGLVDLMVWFIWFGLAWFGWLGGLVYLVWLVWWFGRLVWFGLVWLVGQFWFQYFGFNYSSGSTKFYPSFLNSQVSDIHISLKQPFAMDMTLQQTKLPALQLPPQGRGWPAPFELAI